MDARFYTPPVDRELLDKAYRLDAARRAIAAWRKEAERRLEDYSLEGYQEALAKVKQLSVEIEQLESELGTNIW